MAQARKAPIPTDSVGVSSLRLILGQLTRKESKCGDSR